MPRLPHVLALLATLAALTLRLNPCLALATTPPSGTLNVVLMGATGNLAQKYLWTSLSNIRERGVQTAARLTVWPAATKPSAQSEPVVRRILRENATYSSDASRAAFLDRVAPYTQLAQPDDYSALSRAIAERLRAEDSREAGRLVYLSVPPKFFGGIAQAINERLRPSDAGAWLKVIVEKPFGVDLASAQQLSRELFSHLRADEVLLIDHYCGKATLSALRDFYRANPHYPAQVLTGERVREIRVHMVETEDVRGRTGFYDDVGVVRDTMQNHLMIMLQLAAMDVGNGKSEEENRLAVLRAIPSGEHVLERLGQYADYNAHLAEDGNARGDGAESLTPTYARVAMRVGAPHRLAGARVVLTAGKALKARRAFVQFAFRDGATLTLNVQGELGPDVLGERATVSGAAVHATSGLPEFAGVPPGWTLDPATRRTALAPKSFPNAYEVLLTDALEGRFDSFVKIPEVLEAWRLWSPVLDTVADASREAKRLVLYKHGGQGLDDAWNGVPNAPQRERGEL